MKVSSLTEVRVRRTPAGGYSVQEIENGEVKVEHLCGAASAALIINGAVFREEAIADPARVLSVNPTLGRHSDLGDYQMGELV
jgi:hypothetical protein